MDECLYEQAISKFQHNIQAKQIFFLNNAFNDLLEYFCANLFLR